MKNRLINLQREITHKKSSHSKKSKTRVKKRLSQEKSTYYDDFSTIDLDFDAEYERIPQQDQTTGSVDFEQTEQPTPETESGSMGSFVLKNNEYVYEDGDNTRLKSSNSGTSKFKDLKPQASPSDEADREMAKVDRELNKGEGAKGKPRVMANSTLDFDSLEETNQAEPEAKTKDEEDFAKDLQAILSGEKIYDPNSKDLVENKREVLLDDEVPQEKPTPPKSTLPKEEAKVEKPDDPYALLDQIENNRAGQASSTVQKESRETDYIDFETLEDKTPIPTITTQSIEKVINIQVIEQPNSKALDNGYLPQRANTVDGELRVTSVSDMVQKVLNHLQPGQLIGELVINGHGARGNISVGAGIGNTKGQYINGDSKDWKPELSKLKGKFDETNGSLFLRGCNVGAGHEGSKKLQELADLLKIQVYAPTGLVYPNREEAGSEHQAAFPGFPAPKPKKTPTEISDMKKKASAHSNISGALFKDLEEIKLFTSHEFELETNHSQANLIKSNYNWIQKFQTGLSVLPVEEVRGIAAKVNGIIFLKRGGQYQRFYLFNDFNTLFDNGFSMAYKISPELRDEIISAFKPELSLNSSHEIAEPFKADQGIDITVIDATEDSALSTEAFFTIGELRATSVKDMVDKVLAHLKEGQKIKKLTLVGHGAPGTIVMGSGKFIRSHKHINGDESQWRPELQRLVGKFTADGEIFLNGCNVGARKAGSDKLKKLADLLKVKVYAPTGLSYTFSEEWGSIHQTAYPNKQAPTPIGTPSEVKAQKLSNANTEISTEMSKVNRVLLHNAVRQAIPTDANEYQVLVQDTTLSGLLLEAVNSDKVHDASKMLATVDAMVAIEFSNGTKTYELFNDFNFIAIQGEWKNAMIVSGELKTLIKEQLNTENRSFPQV